MAEKIWIVQYDDANDEDRATSASYRKYEDAMEEAVRIASTILKEESEAIEWDEADLERLKEFKAAVKKGDLEEAFTIWEDISRDLDFAEDVTVDESTLR